MLTQTTTVLSEDEVVDAVVGHRVWFPELRPNGDMLLRGITYPTPWTARGTTNAICQWLELIQPLGSELKHSDIPQENCSCGLHAYSGHDTILDSWLYVRGEVHLWGGIVIHERGFRAAHGKISALYYPKSFGPGLSPPQRAIDIVERAAKTYGVPIVVSPYDSNDKGTP